MFGYAAFGEVTFGEDGAGNSSPVLPGSVQWVICAQPEHTVLVASSPNIILLLSN